MHKKSFLTVVEYLLWLTAICCVCVFILTQLQIVWAMQTSENIQPSNSSSVLSSTTPSNQDESLDTSLWSKKRISQYLELIQKNERIAVADLILPSLKLSIPIYEGADEINLNIGVGRVAGTGTLSGIGNLAIAGHRDSFFRQLGEVKENQKIIIKQRKTGIESLYRVSRTLITTPDDISILEDSTLPSLTLITCYPFYFVGSAPERFIVKALKV